MVILLAMTQVKVIVVYHISICETKRGAIMQITFSLFSFNSKKSGFLITECDANIYFEINVLFWISEQFNYNIYDS